MQKTEALTCKHFVQSTSTKFLKLSNRLHTIPQGNVLAAFFKGDYGKFLLRIVLRHYNLVCSPVRGCRCLYISYHNVYFNFASPTLSILYTVGVHHRGVSRHERPSLCPHRKDLQVMSCCSCDKLLNLVDKSLQELIQAALISDKSCCCSTSNLETKNLSYYSF